MLSIHPPLNVPKVFRFQNMWLRKSNFLQVVRDSWELPSEGYSMYKFSSKLKHLKTVLKGWNQEVFGNITANFRQTEAEVLRLEGIFTMAQLQENHIRLNCT